MSLSRKELTKALIKGLKLDDNIFNYQSVAEETESIQEKDFIDFYKAVMSQDTYGNGLKAIIKVAEQFKPKDNDLESKAKKLISFVETQNTAIGELAKARGTDFNNLVRELAPIEKYKETFAVLDNVKPYYNAKELIINIRLYQTSIDAIQAFKSAIISYETSSDTLAIDNKVAKMIER